LIANEEMMKRMLNVVPAGRLGKGEETAYFAAFLASSYSDFFVGQVFPFSGGWVTST
jgi:2-keto-3-deoxy-L-fuconate dehydrogenase